MEWLNLLNVINPVAIAIRIGAKRAMTPLTGLRLLIGKGRLILALESRIQERCESVCGNTLGALIKWTFSDSY